ncbi:MAG: hypothetical protein AB7G13_29445 [Lautropia sp.]
MTKICRLVWNDIPRRDTATWVGGPEGNWFDPANWAERAVPDLANVAEVVIPAGTAVHFDPAAAVAPTAALAPVEVARVSLAPQGGGYPPE